MLKQKILSLHEEPDVWSTAIGEVRGGRREEELHRTKVVNSEHAKSALT